MLDAMDIEPTVLDDEGEMLVEESDDEALADDDDESVAVDAEVEEQGEDNSKERLTSHGDPIYTVSLKRIEGKLLTVSGGGDDLAMLNNSTALRCHTDSVSCAAFSRDGSRVATGSYDCTVGVWNVEQGTLERRLEGPSEVEWVAWHPRGDVLLAGSQDSTIWMWLATTGECLRVFAGHEGPVNCGLFTLDGNWIVTGSSDSTVKVWGPKKGLCRHTLKTATGGAVTALETHPVDPNVFVAGSEDGYAYILNKEMKVLCSLAHDPALLVKDGPASSSVAHDDANHVTCVSLFGGGGTNKQQWAATGGIDGVCVIWDYSGSAPSRRHEIQLDAVVVSISWHPTKPRLYAAAGTKIHGIDARTGTTVVVLQGHTDAILSMAVDYYEGEDDTILSGGDDKIPRLFQVPSSTLSM